MRVPCRMRSELCVSSFAVSRKLHRGAWLTDLNTEIHAEASGPPYSSASPLSTAALSAQMEADLHHDCSGKAAPPMTRRCMKKRHPRPYPAQSAIDVNSYSIPGTKSAKGGQPARSGTAKGSPSRRTLQAPAKRELEGRER
eukprot:3937940-Rhodomonas_salina.1